MSKTPNPHIRLITAVLTLAIWSTTATAGIIYVDPNAPGPVHDGESWCTAYNFLQDALTDPNLEPGDNIRVANGTYRPDQDSDNPGGTDNRNETFELINDVEIYGGYAGCGAPDPDERKVETYETILTGVLSTKNSYHVVTGRGTDATAVLDGFTITGGNAVGTAGGGMFNYPAGSPTVRNCLFRGNSTDDRGGGMYNWSGSAPTIIGCSFENNSAVWDGGGIYNISASPEISNCTFTGNSVGRYGGGLCNDDSDPVLINCTFSNNTAGERGGGTYNWSTSTDLEFINCTYTGNLATELGGGMCIWNGTANLVDCLFSGNTAMQDGGAMYNKAGDPTITNCTFASNVASGNGGGIFNNELAIPTIANCVFWANTDSSGTSESAQIQGGFPQVTYSCIQDEDPNDGDIPFDDANIDDYPMFVRNPNAGGDGWGDDPCTPGPDEGANDDFGDLHLLPGSPCIDAADNTMVPADTHDLDEDLDTTELTPLDLDYGPRFIDDPTTTNTGNPDPSHDPNIIVDMGAYEYQLVAEEKYCGGTGTIEDPYQICDPNYMQEIGANPDDWDKHFKLIADIDLARFTGTEFNIIGTGGAFSGTFNGNGYTISNFTYTSTDKVYTGLFGSVGTGGEIKDMGMTNVNVDAGTSDYVGGLAGYNRGTISNSYATGSVSGEDSVGGLVGYNYYGTVSNCYAAGAVSGDYYIGGLVGYNRDGTVSNCYSTGSVSGTGSVGGLVGYNVSTVSNCYAAGPVSGTIHVGGLVGDDHTGSYTSCFWDKTVNAHLIGAGDGIGDITDPAEVMGRTTSEMQMQSTFTDYGWDFTTPIWKICDGAGYPRLWWEARALDGDTNNDCRVDLIDLAIVSYQWLDVPGDPSADIAPPGGDGEVNSDDLLVVAANWLAGTQEAVIPGDLTLDLALDDTWMYQNVGSSTNSNLTANVSIIDPPVDNSSYTYTWEFILPVDVTVEPSTISGGGARDTSWNFAAPNVNQPDGLSDSGQALTVKVTVTGDDYGNSGQAEAQFGIALLGDVNNDKVVNIADRSIINAFWRTGSAGSFTLRDCNINSDGSVNIADRSIANAVWRGQLGQNSVSQPCPLR